MRVPVAIAVIVAGAACIPQPQLAACDLLDENCRAAIAHATQKLRGSNGPLPTVLVRSEDQVIADSTSQTTPAERESFAAQNAVLALFDLSTPGLTLAEQTQNHFDDVAAFYSPSTKAVTIIDRGQPLDDEASVIVLAHELVHALQDQDGFLGRTTATTDADLAYTAIIEGEATVYQDLVSFDSYGWEQKDIDWTGSFAHYQRVEDADAIRSATPVYDASLDFVYPFGGAYVLERYRNGGQPAVAAIYDNVPATSYAIGNDAAAAVTTLAVTPPPGYTVANSDSLGWWLFNVWCSRELADASGCSSMTSDIFAELSGPTTAAIWRLHFDDASAAAVVQAQIPAAFTSSVVDGDLLISRGF